jgi:PBP1b-binding outer membrane lipoprotein LpoB
MEKTIKILLILLVVATGCKVTKKATESTVAKTSEQTEAVRTVKEVKDFKESKDVNSELETVTEETVTEFYEPVKDSMTIVDKGPVKTVRTIRTVTTKKDSDKSKVEVVSSGEAMEAVKEHKDIEEVKEHKEVKKTGVATWKIVGGLVALLLVVYFLVKKNVIRIPFLTKVSKRIEGVLNRSGSKTV